MVLSLCAHALLAALLVAASHEPARPPRQAGAFIEATLIALAPPPTVVAPTTVSELLEPTVAQTAEAAALPNHPDSQSTPAVAPAEPPLAEPLTAYESNPPISVEQDERVESVTTDGETTASSTETGDAETSPSTEFPTDTAADQEPTVTVALGAMVDAAVREQLASWTGRSGSDGTYPTLRWREAGQEYTAVLSPAAPQGTTALEQLAVTVTTERDGARLSTELRMTRLAFSNFAQFIDRWDPEVQIHDDVVDGRFHSNSEIRVSHERGVRPVFNGRVTLAAHDIVADGFGSLNQRTMFPAGLETSTRRIALPPRAAAFEPGSVPAERSHRLDHDTHIEFHADGSYEWTQPETGLAGRRELGTEPFYLLASEDSTVQVSGTVNGQVLVYALDQIVVVDDLRYADDPRKPGASNYLGLVAERTVEIADAETTGPGDLEIHASIYARNRFQVRDYRSRRSGTLRIHGSVTAGSVSATEPRFATEIEFDERLTTMRAPGFPLSDRYELDSWSGVWRVVTPE